MQWEIMKREDVLNLFLNEYKIDVLSAKLW